MLGALGVSSLVFVSVAGAAGFSAALIPSQNSFSSATLQLKGTTGANSCYSTGTGAGGTVSANSSICATGSPVPTGSLSSTSSSSAAAALASPGTINASTAAVASASCGVARLSDAESTTDWSGTGPDTALALNGLTYQAPGPLSTQAVTTDGSTGWAETTVEYTNPESFTVLAWFKTSSDQGSIIGFENNETAPTSATDRDRMLWIDSTGHLVWGVFNGTTYESTSSSTYANGAWHFVAASVGSSGQLLYVDGALAGSSSNTSAQSYSGWWSIGYTGAPSGWSDGATSAYFNGSLAQLAVIPSQLSATQVSTLYGDTTLSNYTAGVNALSPVNYWALNDSGSVSYEGSVPAPSPSTTLADDSGNANTGTTEGGVTLGANGPLSGRAITLDGSTGWMQTTNSYANPEGISVVAWFNTSTTSGGTIIGFANAQGDGSQTYWDRLIWVDNSGKVVWGVNPGTLDEVTSSSAYNNGAWHMVVAEIGSSGQQLWVDGTEVASSSSVTSAQNFTGYWHIGWGNDEANWSDAPTSSFLSGSLSQVAIIPSQLSSTQISTLHNAGSTGAFALDIGQLSPTSYWPLQEATTLVDASGNANTGTAEGGVTLGANGPGTLGAGAISLDGSSGWAETANAYANPEGISVVAWFNTSTSSGGTIIGFANAQGDGSQVNWDRLIWVDNSGKVVWGVNPGTRDEVTSSSAYNNGAWHMVVAKIGSAGQQLWVDGTEVGSNSSVTSAQSFTGYWHIGWGNDEATWSDAPTSSFLSGSLSQVAIIPSQLSSAQISTLYNAGSAAAFMLDMGQLSPTSYWPLQDSASNICGTTEITVQQTVGATNTCIYPSAAGTCAAPSSAYLVTGLGVRSITAPTAGTPVSVTVTVKLSAASPTGVLGLHELAGIAFGTAKPSTLWSAQIAYPYAWSQL